MSLFKFLCAKYPLTLVSNKFFKQNFHESALCGYSKDQDNIFIHYQDIGFFFFLVVLTVQLYFPTNCFNLCNISTRSRFTV